jgi:hypothetical protein
MKKKPTRGSPKKHPSAISRQQTILMISEKLFWSVTPAKAGVQNFLKELDSGFRRTEEFFGVSTFYEIIILKPRFFLIQNIRVYLRKSSSY